MSTQIEPTTLAERIKDLSGANQVRPVADYPYYWVTDDGQVWTTSRAQIRRMATGLTNGGYKAVSLRDADGKRHTIRIHRLVATAFLIQPPDCPIVCHRDDNPDNNTLANLYWGSHPDNYADRRRNKPNGIHPQAKMTPSLVREMRRLRREGATYHRIMDTYPGYSYTAVWAAVNRHTWFHIGE